MNTVEFAIKDGIPYEIDFMNPAPDAELASVGETNHKWIVETMTDFIFKKLEEGFETPAYRWSAMLNPAEKAAPQAKPAKAKKTETKTTKTKKAGNAE